MHDIYTRPSGVVQGPSHSTSRVLRGGCRCFRPRNSRCSLREFNPLVSLNLQRSVIISNRLVAAKSLGLQTSRSDAMCLQPVDYSFGPFPGDFLVVLRIFVVTHLVTLHIEGQAGVQ